MYTKYKLKGTIVKHEKTVSQVIRETKIPATTFRRKLENGHWGIDEANAISSCCGFSDAEKIDVFLS